MITHIIADAVVINTVMSTVEEAKVLYPDMICIDGVKHKGAIGFLWDGEKLAPPPLPLADAKKNKLAALKSIYLIKSERPTVDTGLGFHVKGGYQDLADFQVGFELDLLTIRDAENDMVSVTKEEFAEVIHQIKLNGLSIKRRKWELEDLIESAATAEELSAIDISARWG